MNNLTTREEVSKILGFRVAPGKWQETLESIWSSGRPDNKAMKELVFMLCRRVEELEDARPEAAVQSVK